MLTKETSTCATNGDNPNFSIFAGIQLSEIIADAESSRRCAYADGTYANLNCHWVKFLKFCVYFNLIAFPASTHTLAWYAQFISRKLKSHSSVVAHLSSVKTLHKFLNFSIGGFRGFHLKLTLQGLRRNCSHSTKRAKPITPAILRIIHSSLNLEVPEDAVFWCACITAFFLLFRKSNLIPDTAKGFNGEKQLRRRDVIISENNATVGIRWSKNQQFSRELLTFPLPKLHNSILCPVNAVQTVFRLIPATDEKHLFMLPDGTSLSYRPFLNKLRSILKNANVEDYRAYGSHSFRRGGTTFSFLCGIPAPVIKLLGNWKSDSYLSYIEFPLETRTAASELMKIRLMTWEQER